MICAEAQPYSEPPARQQGEGDDAGRQESGAQVVDLRADGRRRGVDEQAGGQQRQGADRDVDVEHPAPAEVVGEEAADERAAHEGGRHHDGHHGLDPAALARRHQFTDDRLRADHQSAAAESLQRAEADELAHVLGQSRQDGAREEEHDRQQEDALAAVEVAELSPDRRGRGRRQQVGGDHPGEMVEAAQVTDDRGQRGGDDQAVEHGEEHAEHQPADAEPEEAREYDVVCAARTGRPLPQLHGSRLRHGSSPSSVLPGCSVDRQYRPSRTRRALPRRACSQPARGAPAAPTTFVTGVPRRVSQAGGGAGERRGLVDSAPSARNGGPGGRCGSAALRGALRAPGRTARRLTRAVSVE